MGIHSVCSDKNDTQASKPEGTKPELSSIYQKPQRTGRMTHPMITDMETSEICLTASSCGWLGENCRWT